MGIACGALALGPSGRSTLAGPALFFILGREGQVPSCLNYVFMAYSSEFSETGAGWEMPCDFPKWLLGYLLFPVVLCVWAVPGSFTNKSHLW